jgi:hypothetical protein
MSVILSNRWTGNGVANGTTVTNTNANSAGNGSTVTVLVAHSTLMTYAGDGVEIGGVTAGNARYISSGTFSGTRQLVLQSFYTPKQHPTGTFETPLRTQGGRITHELNGTACIRVTNNQNVKVGPTWALNNRYQLDMLVLQSQDVRTMSNGRTVVRIRNLDNSTWNTSGEWFWDTGYTVHNSTADLTVALFGKNEANAVIDAGTPLRLEQIGWDTIATDLTSVTSQPAIEEFFGTSPYTLANQSNFMFLFEA